MRVRVLHSIVLSLLAGCFCHDNRIEGKPASCLEAKNNSEQSGLQDLDMDHGSIKVYCDQTTDNGGWIVIQRRLNDRVDFYQNWDQYEKGFGNLSESYWMGLSMIYELTKGKHYTLRVDLSDFVGNSFYAIYKTFSINGPEDYYRLNIGGYSGTAGNSLKSHNNMQFSTYDHDHDTWRGNCAEIRHGGWWYGACLSACLNGRYKNDGSTGRDGVVWFYWRTDFRSMKTAEMKIREWSRN